MENFGEFLYALRKDKGMTQAELAQLLGVTNKAVSKWETGEAMPETSLLIPIARIFGVSVDELLDGKRAERLDGVEDGAERDSEKVSDMKIKDYLFKRGKDEVQTFAEKIQGAVCATIAFGGIVSFLLVGIITGIWHPYWVILPVSTMSCGIVGIILDLRNAKKRKDKIACGENPFTGCVCGLVMLSCIIVYLLLGAILNLWHPMWILLVVGAFACGVISMIVEIIVHKNK